MADLKEKLVEISIRNNISELAIVSNALEGVGKDLEIPKKVILQLQVALDEVLSNIVKYAWPEGQSHALHIRISAREGGVEIIIVDDGESFDPTSYRGPSRPDSRPKPGGVGLQMIKKLVDVFDYACIDGRNQVTLRKRYAA